MKGKQIFPADGRALLMGEDVYDGEEADDEIVIWTKKSPLGEPVCQAVTAQTYHAEGKSFLNRTIFKCLFVIALLSVFTLTRLGSEHHITLVLMCLYAPVLMEKIIFNYKIL